MDFKVVIMISLKLGEVCIEAILSTHDTKKHSGKSLRPEKKSLRIGSQLASIRPSNSVLQEKKSYGEEGKARNHK